MHTLVSTSPVLPGPPMRKMNGRLEAAVGGGEVGEAGRWGRAREGQGGEVAV